MIPNIIPTVKSLKSESVKPHSIALMINNSVDISMSNVSLFPSAELFSATTFFV